MTYRVTCHLWFAEVGPMTYSCGKKHLHGALPPFVMFDRTGRWNQLTRDEMARDLRAARRNGAVRRGA